MEFTIKLTEQEMQLVGDALSELPHKRVVALLGVLQTQINEQLAPPKEPVPPPAPPPTEE